MAENTTTPNADQNGQVPNGSAPTGQVPTPQGQVPNGLQQNVSLDTLPQTVQDYIKELREKDANNRITLKQFADAQKKQEQEATEKEQQRLQEQGEYKKLAEKHEARVKELEPIGERYGALSGLVALQIEAQIKEWPQEVKTFDPGANAPIEQRLDWLEKSKPLIAKLQEQQRATNPGNGPNPRPSGGTPETQQNQFLQQMRRSGKYGA